MHPPRRAWPDDVSPRAEVGPGRGPLSVSPDTGPGTGRTAGRKQPPRPGPAGAARARDSRLRCPPPLSEPGEHVGHPRTTGEPHWDSGCPTSACTVSTCRSGAVPRCVRWIRGGTRHGRPCGSAPTTRQDATFKNTGCWMRGEDFPVPASAWVSGCTCSAPGTRICIPSNSDCLHGRASTPRRARAARPRRRNLRASEVVGASWPRPFLVRKPIRDPSALITGSRDSPVA